MPVGTLPKEKAKQPSIEYVELPQEMSPQPPAQRTVEIENLRDWMEQANARLESVLERLYAIIGGERQTGGLPPHGVCGLEALSREMNGKVYDLESLVESLSNRIGRL